MANSKKSETKSDETTANLGTAGGMAAGAALGSLLGPLGAALGAVVGGIAGGEGRQSGAGKPQTEAKTGCQSSEKVAGCQIGGQECFSEEGCSQEEVRQAEIISDTAGSVQRAVGAR